MPKYFTLSEFLESDTAKAKGINNTPEFLVVAHLQELVDNILDPLRAAWGSPLRVTSGYRCPKLNKAVGGSATSVHQLGYAADIQPTDPRRTAKFILFANAWLEENNIAFDQSIDESAKGVKWLHIGIRNSKGEQRRQFLSIKK